MHGLTSLSEKSWKSNRLQMLEQMQELLRNHFKTLAQLFKSRLALTQG